MNVGHEEEELKPYIEPEADFSDSTRIGMSDCKPVQMSPLMSCPVIYADFNVSLELMVTMGFPKDEITDSLHAQKYDDVMATYLLLGRKAPEVSFFVIPTLTQVVHALCHVTMSLLLRFSSRGVSL